MNDLTNVGTRVLECERLCFLLRSLSYYMINQMKGLSYISADFYQLVQLGYYYMLVPTDKHYCGNAKFAITYNNQHKCMLPNLIFQMTFHSNNDYLSKFKFTRYFNYNVLLSAFCFLLFSFK